MQFMCDKYQEATIIGPTIHVLINHIIFTELKITKILEWIEIRSYSYEKLICWPSAKLKRIINFILVMHQVAIYKHIMPYATHTWNWRVVRIKFIILYKKASFIITPSDSRHLQQLFRVKKKQHDPSSGENRQTRVSK